MEVYVSAAYVYVFMYQIDRVDGALLVCSSKITPWKKSFKVPWIPVPFKN